LQVSTQKETNLIWPAFNAPIYSKLSEKALEYITEILFRIEGMFGEVVKDAVESYCIPDRPFNAMKPTELVGAYLEFMQGDVDDWSF
jgi:hypothetical protein